MNLWISSLSNFFAIAKLATAFSQKPSLCLGKKLILLESLVANWHAYWHVTPFFTVLMHVDKAGLQFYFFLFPSLTANIFSWQFLWQCWGQQKKNIYIYKKRKSFNSKFFIFIFYSLIFFQVYKMAGLNLLFTCFSIASSEVILWNIFISSVIQSTFFLYFLIAISCSSYSHNTSWVNLTCS